MRTFERLVSGLGVDVNTSKAFEIVECEIARAWNRFLIADERDFHTFRKQNGTLNNASWVFLKRLEACDEDFNFGLSDIDENLDDATFVKEVCDKLENFFNNRDLTIKTELGWIDNINQCVNF